MYSKNQDSNEISNDQTEVSSKGHSYPYTSYYKWMNAQLTSRIVSLATALLGNPTYKRPTEWRWGKKGEIVVYVGGERAGRFADFLSGASGDALELVKYKTGYRGKELGDWVKNFIGYLPTVSKKKEEWTPIIPVPEDALNGDITKGLSEGFKQRGMTETGQYCYRDQDDNVLGYVVRFEKGRDKLTLPLTYCVNGVGLKSWKWRGIPVPRLPYGAELLKETSKTVLVVEGEKTCDAARLLFSQFLALTWVAGTGSVHLTNWSVLKNRDVILWPDNDEPGLKGMKKLRLILEKIGARSVRVVSLPSGTPQEWDVANQLPEGWDTTSLAKLIASAD